jgi:hypothetical protein
MRLHARMCLGGHFRVVVMCLRVCCLRVCACAATLALTRRACARARSFHAAFYAAGKATLTLRVSICEGGASASDADADAALQLPPAKPACVLIGEFTAVSARYRRAAPPPPRAPP